MDEDLVAIPTWFFKSVPIRLMILDLLEEWLYVDISTECPQCLAKNSFVYIVDLRDIEFIKYSFYCSKCGYNLGSDIYPEIYAKVMNALDLWKEPRKNQ